MNSPAPVLRPGDVALKAYRLQRYQARKAAGLCPVCGKRPGWWNEQAARQHRLCDHCTAAWRRSVAKRAPRLPQQRRAAHRARYARRKAEGICVRCGTRPARAARVDCSACTDRRRRIPQAPR